MKLRILIAIAAMSSLCMTFILWAGSPASAIDTRADLDAVASTEILERVVDEWGSPLVETVVVTSAFEQVANDAEGLAHNQIDINREAASRNISAGTLIDDMSNYDSAPVMNPFTNSGTPSWIMTPRENTECEPGWKQLFDGPPGLNEGVSALTVFDDGSGEGPLLYVAGSFTNAGGLTTNRIAKWNGSSWSQVGDGLDGLVLELLVFDDGSGNGPSLYAAGLFTQAGGATANRIAKWDGVSWSPLGTGMDKPVRALTVFDDGSGNGPALYAGGSFTSAGGVSARRIAKWDGASWSPLGSGLLSPPWPDGGVVRALIVADLGDGPAMYASGIIKDAGGQEVNNIAKWDGSSWSPVGAGTNGPIYSLVVFDDGFGGGPALYAGGLFNFAGGVSASGVAKWDGESWWPLGEGITNGAFSPNVDALAVFDDGSEDGAALYAAGRFIAADGKEVRNLAKWDGISWSPVGAGTDGRTYALAVYHDGIGDEPALFAGGSFNVAGEAHALKIAKWNGSSWSPLGRGTNAAVRAIAVVDESAEADPSVYVGGAFTTASGMTVNHIAKWDGSTWSLLGSGLNGAVNALTVFDDGAGNGPALYAGGAFSMAGEDSVNYVAKWNGSTWTHLGDGTDGEVLTLIVYDDGTGSRPALIAGGAFTNAGSMEVNNVAKWDGTSWAPLGEGVNDAVIALTSLDFGLGDGPELCVGGDFTIAGGIEANRIAKWNGVSWSPLGGGMNDRVNTLTVFDDGSGLGKRLYAGGYFTVAGSSNAKHVAVWSDPFWSPLREVFPFGMNAVVHALTVFDDGTGEGPALFVGGEFTSAWNATLNRIGKWDGLSWSSLNVGMSGGVYALTPFDLGVDADRALYVGGQFVQSPGGDYFFAKWQGCPLPLECPWDLSSDGAVGSGDLSIFIGSWGPCPAPPFECIADFDGDGYVGAKDLAILLGSWGPCP